MGIKLSLNKLAEELRKTADQCEAASKLTEEIFYGEDPMNIIVEHICQLIKDGDLEGEALRDWFNRLQDRVIIELFKKEILITSEDLMPVLGCSHDSARAYLSSHEIKLTEIRDEIRKKKRKISPCA